MYMSGSVSSRPGSPTAIIDIAPLPPRATTPRPSSGSSARSTSAPPAPIIVPGVRPPSSPAEPKTIRPWIGRMSSDQCMPADAASSAASWSARPSQRAASERRMLGRAQVRLALARLLVRRPASVEGLAAPPASYAFPRALGGARARARRPRRSRGRRSRSRSPARPRARRGRRCSAGAGGSRRSGRGTSPSGALACRRRA